MPNLNTHLLVRNLRGTSGRLCLCGSWIDHWYNETRSTRWSCAVLGCANDATVGAHVQLLDNRDGFGWWIVPMCNPHNHTWNADEMWLDCRVDAVSANARMMGCYRY
jgi:hypothetical protein